ncbi:MAG: WecB/TagA/CpsF family glycosyltransferase [Thermoguttaceae bacterium]|jgi:N-acetylglucosaminyldiphosphoundecaprenol N-acetyl-beta-D-mannosaminyltransferase|nr:WecB/TagA/CpsF family glycosyltransferase [Thermoguttaceae bacterium]
MSELDLPTVDLFSLPPALTVLPARVPEERIVHILGVGITDVTRARAVQLIYEMIDAYNGQSQSVFFVNAHTLNLATTDRSYREILNAGSTVFGDGTGVRWAARMKGIHLRDNLNGTDLVPELLGCMPGRRYYLLGSDPETIRRAAAVAEMHFPNWTLAGFHHGYLAYAGASAEVVRQISAARPDVLLVGMGNPRQERWIHEHQSQLRVPVCMGIGGLFDFWAENVSRAPQWLRRIGHEWIWRLFQQPSDKARRYLLGNPLFLLRAWTDRKSLG